MKSGRIPRILGAATGFVSAALLIASAIFRDIQVPVVASSSTIARAIIENQQSVFVGSYLLMLGVLFFLLFVGYLRGNYLVENDQYAWLPHAAFAGGIVMSAMLLLTAHFNQSLTILSGYGGETQVAKTIYLLKWNWYLLVEAIPVALFVGATSVYGLVQKRGAWWINWPGTAIALLLIVPYVTGGGVMLSYLWIGAFSLHRIISERKNNLPLPVT